MEKFNADSSDHIMLTKRQVSMIMASMLLLCLFIFIVGFFLGKRTVIEDFSSKVTKEALHDQIDFLLTTQSLQNSQEDDVTIEQDYQASTTEKYPSADGMPMIEDGSVLSDFAHDATTEKDQKSLSPNKKTLAEVSIMPEKKSAEHVPSTPNKQHKQYAQLIGFGTKKAAQAFVQRLKKHDISVMVKTVMSKSASGKQRTWYQAITPTYDSEQALHDYVARIKRLEHIRDKDITIVNIT